MVAAAREAADARVLEAVDSVRVVNLLSVYYRDPALLLGQRIGAANFTTKYSGIGGNVPQTLVNRACAGHPAGPRRRGPDRRCGDVANPNAVAGQRESDWAATEQDDSVPQPEGSDENVPMAGEAEIRIKLDRPAYIYPMFEQALRISTGESVDDHRRRIGELWARFSEVAVDQSARVDPRTRCRRGDCAARTV